MGQYKISRCIEASIIDYLSDCFDSDWSGVNVCKTFNQIYKISTPAICIRVGTTIHNSAEIGSNATIRNPQILIDIFGSSDGNRLDLKDYLIGILKNGLPYYEYTIAQGQVQNKIQNGRINILDIDDTPIDFDVEKNKLDTHDRYRHLITLKVSLGRMEI